MAWFKNEAVSFAMPKLPSLMLAATSSDVSPIKAISKSWMTPAPFMATALMIPLYIKSMIRGLSPTLIGCAPIPKTIVLSLRWARAILRAISLRFCAARISGSPRIKERSRAPFWSFFPKRDLRTLLKRFFSGYVLTLEKSKGLKIFFPIGAVAFRDSGSEERLIHHLGDDVPYQNMGFLDARRVFSFGSAQETIHLSRHLSSIPAGKAYSDDFEFFAGFDGCQDIGGIAAGGNSHGHIPFFPQGLHLLGKDLFIVVVVGDAGNGGSVCSQGKCRQGRSFNAKAVDEFSGNVLRVCRAAAVAEEEELVPPKKGLRDQVDGGDKRAEVILEE